MHTTHSPFMVNPIYLERARLVEDRTTREDPDIGAKISTDILSVRGDTLFPLQAALGYDIAQNLFIGRNNLIVEGPSDLVFLTIFSEFCVGKDFTFLNLKITIVPVGGADKIPTFVALLGSHLDITVLVDSLVTQNQRLQDMINNRWTSVDMVWHLSKWANNTTCEWGATTFNSMEQLWLAFVMHELYSKTWNGKDWVVE